MSAFTRRGMWAHTHAISAETPDFSTAAQEGRSGTKLAVHAHTHALMPHTQFGRAGTDTRRDTGGKVAQKIIGILSISYVNA